MGAVLGLNPLVTKWTADFVRKRILLYIVEYAAYLAAWIAVLTVLDWSGTLSSTNSKLLSSALASNASRAPGGPRHRDTVACVAATVASNLRIDKGKHGHVVDRDRLLTTVSDAEQGAALSHGDDKDRRLRMFYDHLLDRRTYLGCRDVLFQGGFKVPFTQAPLACGRAEDFILHLLNNHNILSCSFAAKGSSISRHSRRVCWLTQHAAGLAVAAFIDSLLSLIGLPLSTKPVVNMFIVRPAIISLSSALKIVLARTARYETIGHLVTALLIVGAFVLLLFASLLTPPGVSRSYLILRYFLQVHLLSFFTEVWGAALLFVSTHHHAFYIGSKSIVMVGQLLVETIVRRDLVENIDYRATSRSYCCFRLDSVSPMSLISSVSIKGPRARSSVSRESEAVVAMTTNPMLSLKASTQQETALNPLAGQGRALSKIAPSLETAEETSEEAHEQQPSAETSMEMQDGQTVTLRRFKPEVRSNYANVFHFFQALDQGATSAHSVEAVDIEELRRAAVYDEGAAPSPSGQQGGSVSALARLYERGGTS